jgi:UDPglucose 6-dehydrogenase
MRLSGGTTMDLSIIGNGYVGLVTSVGLAGNGHHVTCIDSDLKKVTQINQGICPFYEPSIDGLLSRYVKVKHSLKATEDVNEIARSDVIFICVGTFSGANGQTDYRHIMEAAGQIGSVLRNTDKYHLVVIKSTVVPGTTEEIIIPALEQYSLKKAGRDFGVVVNPEFLQESNALTCFQNPHRIIIGEHDRAAGDILESIYRELPCRCPIVRTDIRTAEMIKYASNAFLATRISFINEIGNLCKELGIDVYEVARGMGYDPRIGDKFLNAGLGFGGSCLPKDLAELISKAQRKGYKPQLLREVLEVNKKQPLKIVDIAEKRLGKLTDKVIAVLGLAFKTNTDDIREAPSLKIIDRLLERGALVKVYDPEAMPPAKATLPRNIKFCTTVQDAINESDCVLIVTEWDEFRNEKLYAGKLVIDGRRVLDPELARRFCQYEGVCW